MTREYSKIKEKAKEPEISLEIIDGIRKFTFEKDCLDEIEIFRKKGQENWISLVKNVSSPYFDEDKVEKGSYLEYKVCIFTSNGQKKAESFFQVRE